MDIYGPTHPAASNFDFLTKRSCWNSFFFAHTHPLSITTKNGVILQDIWPKHHVHCARWGIYYGAKTLHTHTQATCMRVPISKVFGGGSDGVLMSNFLAYPPVATFRILADNGWRLSLYRSEGNTFSNPSCWAGGFFSQIRFNSG